MRYQHRFSDGTFRVDFYSMYGGAPLEMQHQGRQIIHTHAGEGFQFTVETGQDSTQASANGIDPFPICRLNEAPAAVPLLNYYAREVELTMSRYTVRGFFPFFWYSHDPTDDFIPKATPLQTGWRTKYSLGGRSVNDFYNFGTPIWFESTSVRPSGILMVGNEMATGATDPMVRIREGRVSFKTRVFLGEASADAFAGVLYRKSLNGSPNTTMDQCYAAPGYMLLVNKTGGVQVLGPRGMLWDGGVNSLVKNNVNGKGVLIEIRTHNALPSYQEVWIENQLVKIIDTKLDPAPVLGPYVGVIASCKTGRVRFSERQIFDVSMETEATYTARNDGGLESLLTVRNAPAVTSPMRLYRVNHVAFLEHSAASSDLKAIRSDDGILLTEKGAYLPYLFGLDRSPKSLWAGRRNFTLGLACDPTLATIDGQHSPGAHGLIATPPAIMHLNALPFAANNTPISTYEVRLGAKWYPTDAP
ncbi:MAG: hypothetical protein AABP62_13160 [Planctomycetota bacterium]